MPGYHLYHQSIRHCEWLTQNILSGQGDDLPVKRLCHTDKATQRKEDQKGLGLLVDLWRTKVINPSLQNICTFFRI